MSESALTIARRLSAKQRDALCGDMRIELDAASSRELCAWGVCRSVTGSGWLTVTKFGKQVAALAKDKQDG